MAVLPMKRISICALKSERKMILELLQRQGVVEITDVMEEDSVFTKADTSESAQRLSRHAQIASQALEILDTYAPEKTSLVQSFLGGRKEIPADRYNAFDSKHELAYNYAKMLVNYTKNIAECKAEQLKIQASIEALSPWEGLDVALSFTGTKSTSAFVGTLPGAWTEEAVALLLAEQGPVDVYVISTLTDSTCVFILAEKSIADSAFDVLRANGFARPAISSPLPPSEQKAEYEKQLSKLSEEISKTEDSIRALKSKREMLRFYVDYDTMRAEKYNVINHLLQSEHVFFLTGFVAAKNVETLTKLLNESFTVEIDVYDPDPKEEVPVIFNNNGFASPLESVTEGFAPPGRGEMDPTFPMSLFYYVLFGIMFSDAGYGLILVIACGLILIVGKKLDKSMKQFMKMFLFCGISTTFWGFLFGSFFGDAVGTIASTFFNSTTTLPPLWFSPNDEPMRMLVFAMALGIIHLFTGLALKFVQSCKLGCPLEGVYDGLFWIGLVGGLIGFMLSTEMFTSMLSISFTLPSTAGTVCLVIAGICGVGILFTAGRESKNWFKRLLKGAYGLYGMTSYLGDILSYSRLLALGLATGIIANVVNKMGSMIGNPIAFALVFIVGHLLNFAINILGAYVHTNRLQYVEFFGKFYDGGGRMFDPFSAKTQFFKITEKAN